MMQRNKVIYTPVAVDDMDEIFSYIAQDNISVAENMLEKLDAQISKLETFLEMGSKLSDEDYKLAQRGYRFIVVHPYMVFYQKINQTIIIYRILHGRRDYLRELFSVER